MVYTARHGRCEPNDRGNPEWGTIAQTLKDRYGETLTAAQVRAEI